MIKRAGRSRPSPEAEMPCWLWMLAAVIVAFFLGAIAGGFAVGAHLGGLGEIGPAYTESKRKEEK